MRDTQYIFLITFCLQKDFNLFVDTYRRVGNYRCSKLTLKKNYMQNFWYKNNNYKALRKLFMKQTTFIKAIQ